MKPSAIYTTIAIASAALLSPLIFHDTDVEAEDEIRESSQLCALSLRNTVFPALGIVIQEEDCNSIRSSALIQWNFGTTQEVCPGFKASVRMNDGGGIGIGFGSCTSIFSTSVNAEQRDEMLELLNEARANVGLPAYSISPP